MQGHQFCYQAFSTLLIVERTAPKDRIDIQETEAFPLQLDLPQSRRLRLLCQRARYLETALRIPEIPRNDAHWVLFLAMTVWILLPAFTTYTQGLSTSVWSPRIYQFQYHAAGMPPD